MLFSGAVKYLRKVTLALISASSPFGDNHAPHPAAPKPVHSPQMRIRQHFQLDRMAVVITGHYAVRKKVALELGADIGDRIVPVLMSSLRKWPVASK